MHQKPCQVSLVPKLPRVAIVCPCFNEGVGLRPFFQQLLESLQAVDDVRWEFIFVDDGSRDSTLQVLLELAREDERVTIISLSRNFGHQAALTAGIESARAAAIICMDSDLQHPPALIPKMLDLWRNGADVVCGVRDDTTGASLFKRVTSRAFYRLMNRISDTQVPSGAADFFLMSKVAHVNFCRLKERHRFLRGMLSWIGFERQFLNYTAPLRFAGKSKYSLKKMITLALDGVFSFSVFPIRLAFRFSLCVILTGGVYLLYILARAILLGDLVQGWGSMISISLILGGIQLFVVGLLGEYIARIYEENKGRPVYIVKRAQRCRAYRSPRKGARLNEKIN